ncbi:MAG: aminoacyl-tRNA hydrolase [Patescibacteria group bacterium]
MKLIIGLGNPGKKYENTWHNLGFMAVERIRQDFDLPKFKKSTKFKAEISTGEMKDEKIILAKPFTYMNNSGEAAIAIKNFYKIKIEDIIVIRDDVDLPLGAIRLLINSSSGGHNGVNSIITQLGTKEFVQIKIGIRTDETEKIGTLNFVLEKISRKKEKEVKKTIAKAVSASRRTIIESLQEAMNEFN